MCPRVPAARSDAMTTFRERLPTCGRRAVAPLVPCAAGWSHASGRRMVIVAPSTAAISTCSSRDVNARPRSDSRSCRVSGKTIRSPAAQPCSGRSSVNVVCDARASPVSRAKVGVLTAPCILIRPSPMMPLPDLPGIERAGRTGDRRSESPRARWQQPAALRCRPRAARLPSRSASRPSASSGVRCRTPAARGPRRTAPSPALSTSYATCRPAGISTFAPADGTALVDQVAGADQRPSATAVAVGRRRSTARRRRPR